MEAMQGITCLILGRVFCMHENQDLPLDLPRQTTFSTSAELVLFYLDAFDRGLMREEEKHSHYRREKEPLSSIMQTAWMGGTFWISLAIRDPVACTTISIYYHDTLTFLKMSLMTEIISRSVRVSGLQTHQLLLSVSWRKERRIWTDSKTATWLLSYWLQWSATTQARNRLWPRASPFVEAASSRFQRSENSESES